ncbi:hypothetical protein KM043_007722 [Ampulex compressa]|nr:hypothetical protein KM043_007722 [Ampulex compressa]
MLCVRPPCPRANRWHPRGPTDPSVCFLERKYSPGAAIERYYQYQTLYLRLMAENQLAENTVPVGCQTVEEQSPRSSCELLSLEKVQEVVRLADPPGNQGTTNVRDATGYSCPRCGNAYTRPHSLNRHMRFECGVEPQFECPICHKKSKHKHNLVLHMRTHQKP